MAEEPASGIFVWLSRDPIGEAGGLNLYGFVGNDGVNRWDVLGLCKIEVRYRGLFFVTYMVSAGYLWWHAYVVVTDIDGSQRVYSGWPSGDGPSSSSDAIEATTHTLSPESRRHGGTQGRWGSIETYSDTYLEGALDWEEEFSGPSVTVLDDDTPCKCYLERLERELRKIEEAQIPYNPLTANSNSVAHDLIERIGLERPTPPAGVWAPGHGQRLPDPITIIPEPEGYEVGSPFPGWRRPDAHGYTPY